MNCSFLDRFVPGSSLIPALVLCAAVLPNLAEALPLYFGDVQGNLHQVDPETGATSLIGSYGTGGGHGLASTPGDPWLYSFDNRYEASIGISRTRLLRIDPSTGEATPFPFLGQAELGPYKGNSIRSLAIDPNAPGEALVSLLSIDLSRLLMENSLVRIDLTTGLPIGDAVPVGPDGFSAMTYSLDGSVLYGTIDGFFNGVKLVTVDPATGVYTIVGDPGLSPFLTGLVFDPEDGTLFAINAYNSDELVILNPTDGSHVSTIGPLGIAGPTGLAFGFPVPEPGTATLLGIGPLAFSARRRARGPRRLDAGPQVR